MDGLGLQEGLDNLIGYPMLWRVLLNSAVIALIAAWLGVQILARGIVFLGLTIAQGAAAGMTLAFWLRFYSLLGSVAFVLATALTLGSPRFHQREGAEEGKIAVLYTTFLALGALFLVLNPHGEGRMLRIFYGNVLTIDLTESVVLWAAAAGLVGFQLWRWKGFLWLSADPRTAAAFGVPFRPYNLMFFILLGLGLALLLHFAGLVVPLALMIVPAYTAFHAVTGMKRVMGVALALAVVPMLLAVMAGLAFAPDYPLGSMIAIGTLALSLAFYLAIKAAESWRRMRGPAPAR
ncbi:MAG: metal ABC transporter permease [SAR324 cluster bacterium]|nr:metal ABC transporter permease [SAR324 cluster bacterium]